MNPEHSRLSLAVRIVPYDERFLERSWHWLRDEEIRHLTMTPSFTREQQNAWFERLPSRTDYQVWGVEVDGTPIGALGLKSIESGSAELWFYIGEKRYWSQGIGRWLVEEAIRQAAALEIHHLTAKVRHDNHRSIRTLESAGFSRGNVETEVIWLDLLHHD